MRGIKSKLVQLAGATTIIAQSFLPNYAIAQNKTDNVLEAYIASVIPNYSNMSEQEKSQNKEIYEKHLLETLTSGADGTIPLDVLSYLENKYGENCTEVADYGFRFPVKKLASPTLEVMDFDGNITFHAMQIPRGTSGGVAYENGKFGKIPAFDLDNLAYIKLHQPGNTPVNVLLRDQENDGLVFQDKVLNRKELQELGRGIYHAQVTDANCDDPDKAAAYNLPFVLMTGDLSKQLSVLSEKYGAKIEELNSQIAELEAMHSLKDGAQVVYADRIKQLSVTEEKLMAQIYDLLENTGGSISLKPFFEIHGNPDLLKGISLTYGITKDLEAGLRYGFAKGADSAEPIHIYTEPNPDTSLGSTQDIRQDNKYQRNTLEGIIGFDISDGFGIDLHAGVQRRNTTNNYTVEDAIFSARGQDTVIVASTKDHYSNQVDKTGPVGGFAVNIGSELLKLSAGINLADGKKPGYEIGLQAKFNWGGYKK